MCGERVEGVCQSGWDGEGVVRIVGKIGYPYKIGVI